MSWDFTVDSDIQLDMAQLLYDKADELDTQFANLYTQIGPSNLGMHWVGSDYDAFNVGCEGYKQALQDMTDSIRMYAAHFEQVAEGTDYLSTACIDIVTNMTTRGDALPSGAMPVAPTVTNPTGGTQYGGGTSTVYGPPTGGTNRFNGGSNNPTGGTQQGGGTSTVYGPPTGGNGYGFGTSGTANVSTVYGPAPTPSQGGGYSSGPSTVYGPPTNNRFGSSGGTANVSTVYGPAPTPSQGGGYTSNISTVYGPAPTQGTTTVNPDGSVTHSVSAPVCVYAPPQVQVQEVKPNTTVTESSSAPVCVYAPPQVQVQQGPTIGYGTSSGETTVCVYAPPQYMPGTEGGGISTKYGAPCTDGTIGYGSSTPISTVYGPAPKDSSIAIYPGQSGTSTPISTVYGAPTTGSGTIIYPDRGGSSAPISTVYGAPVQDTIKVEKL